MAITYVECACEDDGREKSFHVDCAHIIHTCKGGKRYFSPETN